MAGWAKDELRRIAETDDLHVAPFRDDGVTYGTPTWIWSVAVDDALYVRAYNAKYRGSPYLSPMVAARARGATVRVMPRDRSAR